MTIFTHVIRTGRIRPVGKTVFATDLEQGARLTRGGIILPDDNMTARGVHARWAKIYDVGPDVVGIKPGEWVLVSHGRWTLSFEIEAAEGKVKLWALDYPEGILMVSDEPPAEHTVADLNTFRRVV